MSHYCSRLLVSSGYVLNTRPSKPPRTRAMTQQCRRHSSLTTVTAATHDWLTVTDRAPTNIPPRIDTGDSQTMAKRVTGCRARLARCGFHNVSLPCVRCLGEGRVVAVPRMTPYIRVNICTHTHIAYTRIYTYTHVRKHGWRLYPHEILISNI